MATSQFNKIKHLYENAEYLNLIKVFELINEKIQFLSIHEQLMFWYYYIQSLLNTNSMKKLRETTNYVQNTFSLHNLDNINKVIYYSILILGFGGIGNFDKELLWYIESSEFAKKNKSELIDSIENIWYYQYFLVAANFEIKQKNFFMAYDILKQSSSHFLNITDKTTSDKLLLASINMSLGQLHKQTNYFDIAVTDFKNVVEWGLQAHNIDYTRNGYLNLALTYEEQGKEYLAIKTANELMQQVQSTFESDEFSLSSANNLLGNIYNRMGDFIKAKDYYLRAAATIMDPGILQKVKSFNFNNMGVISFKLGDYTEALNYYLLALELAIIKQDPKELAIYYTNIGEVYLELNRLDEALENELLAITYLNIVRNDDMLVETYFIIIRICLEQKNYEKADYYINEIHGLAVQTKRSVFDHKYNISKAIKLRTEQKYDDAKLLFLTILETPNLSYDLQSIALTELAETLLYSIMKFNANHYYELEKIGQKLMLLGKQKKSLPVICNLATLLARIKMLQSQFDLAESILQEALATCAEKNVDYFKKKIQNELELCQEVKNMKNSDLDGSKRLLKEIISTSDSLRRIRELQRLMVASNK